MGEYIHFTEEQKQRANRVDLENFLEMQGEKLIKSGREKRLSSDHSITVRGNKWYDHSAEKGGYAIDFVKQFYNLSFSDAVTMLLNGEKGKAYRQAKEKKEEIKPFVLPNRHSNIHRVYAYLVKTRNIDCDVISFFAKEKLIYESCEKSKDGIKEYHNAVFVGIDENGVPKHVHKKGVYTEGVSFRGNIYGCDPRYSFHWVGESETLYVFEAPIDMLSYITLNLEDWQKNSYVSLCGISSQAMMWMLEKFPQLKKVSLCLDNDKAGHKASERLKNQLKEKGYISERIISKNKDWNEDLINQNIQDEFEIKMA